MNSLHDADNNHILWKLILSVFIIIGALIILALLLRTIGALANLSSVIREHRAARRADSNTIAQNIQINIENGASENGMIKWFPIRTAADMRLGRRSDEETTSPEEEQPQLPANALINDRVWWVMYP